MKTVLFTSLKVITLTVILFIIFSIASTVVGLSDSQATEQAGSGVIELLAVCFLDTIVLTYIILRSRWAGWKLIAAVFIVFYGVMTFMSQIESAVFVTTFPEGVLPKLFLMGILIAAPFAVLAVLILGRGKSATASTDFNNRLLMPANEWIWKLMAIAIAYLVLYFTFGYFIAWQNPDLRAYYGGVDEGSFFAHMGTVIENSFWLFPFQVLRAMLWVAIALPLIRMMKGPWQETAFALGLAFAVLMNAQLLLPNPYMPESVRMTHLLETATSNFIFGLLVGWLLARQSETTKTQMAKGPG
jgi:hypothetical protein